MQLLALARGALGARIILRGLSTTGTKWIEVKTVQQTVDPYAKIRINCAYNLKIVPYDLLDCPDSNLLRATVKSEENKDNIAVKVSENHVSISNGTNDTGTGGKLPECTLEIPIKADLEIRNAGTTTIADLYSDEIAVECTGNIDTKSLRSTNVALTSTAGSISCRGITLAQNVVTVACGKGNIFLDKLQGGSVSASTEDGNIIVNASYSNQSYFRTRRGNMELKSIHKECTVKSDAGNSFTMNGFYGTLHADVGSENVSLQLSETVGKNTILARKAKALQLNLADTVYESSAITVNASKLELDGSMDDKAHKRNGNSVTLGKEGAESSLHVEAAGSVTLRKMSWADSFSFAGKMEQ
ncbi:protein FAM185A [Anopheles aquasalis]|uniref:protein FAM185A n=1 Tax=Anopheles aquasalis TaxID=42839 RepID=UPI00215ABC97|nr:protein FAM185A [Anopheles aquasalis]